MNAQQASNILRYFNLSFTSIVVPLGSVFNTIAMVIFCQRALNRSTVNGFMNAFLCLYNTIALLNLFFLSQFLPALGINLLAVSQFTCKFFTEWRLVFIQLPSIQQMLISLFYYLSTRYPAQCQFVNKRSFVVKAMALAFFFLCLVDTSTLWYYQTSSTANNITTTSCQSSWEIGLSFDILLIFIRAVIPFTALLILNIKILYIIRDSAKRLAQTRNSVTSNASTYQPVNQVKLAYAILCVNILIFIFYTPWLVASVLNYVFTKSSLATSANINQASFRIYYSLSISFSYIFNCTPFFVNFYFNRLFRLEVNRICSGIMDRILDITGSDRTSSKI